MSTLLIDTREPWPHPWAKHLADVRFERCGLETGDIALAGNPSLVVERKTVSDFLGSITSGRDRFEAELKRSRLLDKLVIVVEGDFSDCIGNLGGMSLESFLGTVAAISRRYCPILFAGNEALAARVAWKFLSQPIAEWNKTLRAIERCEKTAEKRAKALALTPVDESGQPLY